LDFVRQLTMQTTLLFCIYALRKKHTASGIIMALLVNIKIKACYLYSFLIRLKKHANLNRTWEDYPFS